MERWQPGFNTTSILGARLELSGMSDGEFGSTSRFSLPKKIAQKPSRCLLEVSRPHLKCIKNSSRNSFPLLTQSVHFGPVIRSDVLELV